MFYGISWHHGVLNVPWRVQNLRTRSFVTRVHCWPWYSICNYLCNNILLLWLWPREREQVNDPSFVTALPAAAAPPHHCQPQHANTGKLSNLLRNIQNIINTRLMPPRVGANNEAEWSVFWSALDRSTFPKIWHTFFILSISNKYLSWRKDRIKFINVRIEPSQRVWEELGMSLGVRYTWEIFL